jgi:hypothetical protein
MGCGKGLVNSTRGLLSLIQVAAADARGRKDQS